MKDDRVVKIKEIDNGFIVSFNEFDDETEEKRKNVYCYEINTLFDEKQTLETLMYDIAEYFGFGYNGFSEKNFYISWNKIGDGIEKQNQIMTIVNEKVKECIDCMNNNALRELIDEIFFYKSNETFKQDSILKKFHFFVKKNHSVHGIEFTEKLIVNEIVKRWMNEHKQGQ